MPIIEIKSTNGKIEKINIEQGKLLSDAITLAEPDFFLPCGGKHSCGKCIVQAKGELSTLTKEEAQLVSSKTNNKAENGYVLRLACACHVIGNCSVILPDVKKENIAMATLNNKKYKYDGTGGGTGIAVDIGTTTVTLLLYDLSSSELVYSGHEMNRQGIYGADVLSRISYSNKNGTKNLVDAIQNQIKYMVADAIKTSRTGIEDIKRFVITGNTTMLHYLKGLNPKEIGEAPFKPESLFGEAFSASTLFSFLPAETQMYLPACISAYVGADISCGLLYLQQQFEQNTYLLVDVGTNGEMAICHNGEITCCATAAGPAFEGAEISTGMAATNGAIYKVNGQNGELELFTIGNMEPKGICGTGLISILNFMVSEEIIDFGGKIQEDGHAYAKCIVEENGQLCFLLSDNNISINQQDIRQIQLAKSAICSGIDTLIKKTGLNESDINNLYLAGGFGSYIDVEEAAGMGLIPKALAAKTTAIGNSALYGAVENLFALKTRNSLEKTAAGSQEVNLSQDPYFMERYVENMLFEEE